jgi:tRNA nucleotidyltransferase (CCA-adding enzyme)
LFSYNLMICPASFRHAIPVIRWLAPYATWPRHAADVNHHEPDRELPANWHHSGELTGATTTLLAELLSTRGLTLTHIEATLLLLGVYEDTGSLSYPTTTARDARAAAWLLDQGARLDVAGQFLHHPLAAEQRELYERLLAGSTTFEIEGHTIALASAEAPEFSEEISTLAHAARVRAIRTVRAGRARWRVQLVARSATDDIDVGGCLLLGGAGHRRAACAFHQGPHPGRCAPGGACPSSPDYGPARPCVR